MNFITRKLLPLLLVSTSIGYALHAMDHVLPLCKDMSNQDLILGIKELPEELKRYIISFLLQNSLCNFKLYKTFNTQSIPTSLAFSPDGETVIIGFPESSIKDIRIHIWNLQTEKKIIKEVHEGNISCVTFSPNEKTYLTGSHDKTACVWNFNYACMPLGKLLTTFKGHTNSITSAVFSPNGENVLTGSADTTACLWNSKTGELLQRFKGHSSKVTCVAFSPDGETILTGSTDTTACLWNSKTGQLLYSLTEGKAVTLVAFSLDGETAFIGSSRKLLSRWNSKTGELLETLSPSCYSTAHRAFSLTGETVLSSLAGKAACLCDLTTGELLATLPGSPGTITSGAFSLDGEMCVTGSLNRGVQVWKKYWCDFTNATPEEKEKLFKLFLTFYPFLHTKETQNK